MKPTVSAAFVLLAVFATADWTDSCSSWKLSGDRRTLEATCTSTAGKSVCSALDLNECLAFDGTSLIWEADGNYSPSNASLNDDVHECVHVQELCSYLSSSSGSTEYSCQCFDPASDDNDGISTSIDLAEQISSNVDGYLTCLGQVAAASDAC